MKQLSMWVFAAVVLATMTVAAAASDDDGAVPRTPVPEGVVTIMPFGDSLTTCCHSCEVSPQGLPHDVRARNSEPRMAYEGYMRALWKLLQKSLPEHRFDFVGRQRDCIFAKPNGTRATTDDWPVRFEGHFGHTTKMILKKGVAAAAVLHVVNATGRAPDVTLVHLGTNDLILGKGRYAGGKLREILRILAFGGEPDSGAASTTAEGTESLVCRLRRGHQGRRRRVIVVAVPMPVDMGFVTIGASNADSLRTRRKRNAQQAGLHGAVAEAVVGFCANASSASVALPAVAASDPDRSDRTTVTPKPRPRTWPVLGSWTAVPSGRQSRACSRAREGAEESPAATSGMDPVDVVLVDMFTDVEAHEALHGDGVHPNARGEDVMARRFLAGIRYGLLGTTTSDVDVTAGAPTTGSPPVKTSTQAPEVAPETVAVTEAVKSAPSTNDGGAWAGAEFIVLPIGAVAVAAALVVRRSRRS